MANSQKEQNTAKHSFEETQTAGLYAEQAKNLGSAIFKKITSLSDSNALAEIHAKIAAAATQGDDALLEKLFAELNKAKLDQKNIKDQYKTIRGNNSFQTILQAYSEEFRELAYSIATEVVKGTHVALKGAKTRKSSTVEAKREVKPSITYTVKNAKGDKSHLTERKGRAAANLSQDKEIFEFLGFKIEKDADGKEHLNPSTIKLNDGTEIPATRPNIVRAITEKTAFDGFTITQ